MKQHVTKYFVEWSEGKLTPAQQSDIESHLLSCVECKQYYQTMSEWLDIVDEAALPRLQPDPFLPKRIAAIAREHQETVVKINVMHALRYGISFGILLLALGIGAFLGQNIAEEAVYTTQTQQEISVANSLWGDSWFDNIENINLTDSGE
jgi:predicted anti-sigma-YlaC factor YlaD